jgi:hypothetical protein
VLASRSTDPATTIGAQVVMAGIAAVGLQRPENGEQELRIALISLARRAVVDST